MDAAVAAMRAHPGSAMVQWRVCAAMNYLLPAANCPVHADQKITRRALTAGAWECATAAWKAHRGDDAAAVCTQREAMELVRQLHDASMGFIDQTWRDDIDLTITQRPGHVMLKDYQRNGKPATQRRGGGG